MFTAWAVLALAAPPSARDVLPFELVGGEAWLVDLIELQAPGIELALGEGYAFPVTLDGEPAGLVWVGDGEATVLPTAREGEVIANHLVVLGGGDRDALAPVADGDPWTLAVDRVVWLSRDLAVQDALESQTPVRRDLLPIDEDGVPVLTVTSTPGLASARATARADLRDRTHRGAELSADPRALFNADDAFGEPAPSTWTAMHGPSDLGPLLEPHHGDSGDDLRWLHAWHDPHGTWSREHTAAVAVLGWSRDNRPARRLLVRRGPPPEGGLVAEARVVQVVGHVDDTHREVVWAIEASLIVRAEGEMHAAVLELPRVRQRAWGANNPELPTLWDLDWVRDDAGGALAWTYLDPGDVADPTSAVRISVPLAPPLADGDVTTVRVRWQDNTRLRHMTFAERGTGLGSHEEIYPLGTATLPLRVLPGLVHAAGPPAPALVQAGVAEEQRLELLLGGTPAQAPRPPGVTTAASVTWGEMATVSAGKWRTRVTEPEAGHPAVRVSTLPDSGSPSALDAQLRAVVAFFEPVLPLRPQQELALIEFPSLPGAIVWFGPYPGIVPLPVGEALTYNPTFGRPIGPQSILPEAHVRRQMPHLEWVATATAVAAQPWLDADDSAASAWQRQAFGRAYAVRFAHEVFDDDAPERWQALWREGATRDLPDRRVAFVPTDIVDGPVPSYNAICAATIVASQTLAGAAGELAWRRAVDELLQGEHGPVGSVDALAAALSSASGRELGPLVRFWLETGLPPSVDLRWAQQDDQIELELTADVPFGTFEVPIRLSEDEVVRVVVIDGHGALTAALPAGELDVAVDPEGELLLWARRASRR